MENGIQCKIKSSGKSAAFRIFEVICAVLCYVSFWGCVCSMATLGKTELLPLSVGGAVMAVLMVIPRKKHMRLCAYAVAFAVAAAVFLIFFSTSLNGVKLILNRIFAASESKQNYIYDRFTVTTEENLYQSAMGYAMVSLGIFLGIIVSATFSYNKKPILSLILMIIPLSEAYFGVSPRLVWNVILAVSVLLVLIKQGENDVFPTVNIVAVLAIFAIICIGAILLIPSENQALSQWDEGMRDTLALNTLAYSDNFVKESEKEETIDENKEFYREEDSEGDLNGDDEDVEKPFPVIIPIILLALVLFIPAILSDITKKRREKNRRELYGEDNGVSTKALFLYTMRWFNLGGISDENKPYSQYAGEIGEKFSKEVRDDFEKILPIWQEAAYSTHEVSSKNRSEMQSFMERNRKLIWESLGKKKRFMAKYFYAL